MPNENLGVVVTNATARKIIYGVYVVAVLIAASVQVYVSATQVVQPEWLTGALAVLAFLGAPIGGLAAANASNGAVAPSTPQLPAPVPYVVPTPTQTPGVVAGVAPQQGMQP